MAVRPLYRGFPITAGKDTHKDTLTKTAHGHNFKGGLAALALGLAAYSMPAKESFMTLQLVPFSQSKKRPVRPLKGLGATDFSGCQGLPMASR